uniref:Secreted protein n=1 Tax=Opuntia streptacantha TaxID=393608 RepID=A0A7C9AD85_OPUST
MGKKCVVRWLRLIFRFLLYPPSLCKSSCSPSNSLSNLLLRYSMWTRMVVEWNGVEFGPFLDHVHHLLKGKNRQNAQENERLRRKTANSEQDKDARSCVPRSTVVPPPTTGHGG